MTGIALGMAIHFKVYPILFCLPLYSALSGHSGEDTIANYARSLLQFNRAKMRLVLGKWNAEKGMTDPNHRLDDVKIADLA